MAISIELPKETIEKLDEIARGQEHSRSQVIRIAIKNFIENEKRIGKPTKSN